MQLNRGTTTATTTTTARRSAKNKRSVAAAAAAAAARQRYARHDMIERLESRQLLTTLFGGGDGQLRTYLFATDGSTVFDAQINIYGNVIAEFIFMHGETQEIPNRTLNGNVLGLNVFSDNPTTATGSDIFAIYVHQADINSYISINERDPTTGLITPFGGARGFDVIPTNGRGTDTTPAAPAGAGSLLLGATTSAPNFDEAIIKTDINGAPIGVRPAGLDDLPEDPDNDLSAGLRVANGQSLGKFLFDGTIFGKVRVDGSMNMFYAGWLLTGDARGASEGSGPSGRATALSGDTVTPEDQAQGEFSHIVPAQNFYVGGDLQHLLTVGVLGWDGTYGTGGDLFPFYLTGTDIYVRGRLGNVQSNAGSAATIAAANMDPATAGFTRPVGVQMEVESLNAPPGSGVAGDFSGGFPNTPQSNFVGGLPYQPGQTPIVPFRNDTFFSFQFLGTFNSQSGNDIIDVVGNLNTNTQTPVFDPNDYYGVGLMAGQTIQLQLRSGGNAYLGVFDPDGRLIASDYNNLTTPLAGGPNTNAYTYNQPFQITADRPGIYRVAVGIRGDVDFNNFVGATSILLTAQYYQLLMTNVGPMAIGGVRMGNNPGELTADGADQIIDVNNVPRPVESLNGDVGGIYTGGRFYVVSFRDVFQNPPPTPPGGITTQVLYGSVNVLNGNLRAIDGTSLGLFATQRTGPDLAVPNGSVGLVQARDPAGRLELNPSITLNLNFAGPVVVPSPTPTSPADFSALSAAIGRDYQVIDAANEFEGGVIARGGMGILRAGSIVARADSTLIILDADNVGLDGKSDLIDVAGSVAGPALYHGPGGNFRYMRVGGTVGFDPQFGIVGIGYTVHDYGQSASFVDDSGSIITVTPTGRPVLNPAFSPLDPTFGPQFFTPQLTSMVYPVRSGGVIVMDVQSTQSIAVNSQGGAFNATAEISRLEVHGSGAAPLRATRFTKNGYVTTLTTPPNSFAQQNELSVIINGNAITDVAYIAGMTPEPTNNFYVTGNVGEVGIVSQRSAVSTFGNLTLVANNTGGEILSINAAALGNLRSTGTIGIQRTTSIPGNALNFIAPITVGTGYAGRTGADTDDRPVNPTGTAVGTAFPFNLQTFGIAVGGDIVSVVANRGLGNIISTGIIGSIIANADGKNVQDVHEGINAPVRATSVTIVPGAGTGAGGTNNGSILFVNIGEGVLSAGSGDMARSGIFAGNSIGSIVGNNADIRGTVMYGQTLGNLTLTNGSLIDATVLNQVDGNEELSRESGGPGGLLFTNPGGSVINLGSININGNGGIIGTLIATVNIGSITVGPSGFGIISSQIQTGFNTNFTHSITAGGYGIRDTIIGIGGNLALVNATGNGKQLSTNNVSQGVRQSEFVRAVPELFFGFDPYSGRPLTSLNDIHSALGTSQSTPVIPGLTTTGVIENSWITSQRQIGKVVAQIIRGPYMRLTAGNSIDTIQTRGLINGLFVITGRINHFLPASDVLKLNMTISGPLDNINIKGTLGAGSVIQAIGPNGRIGTINIKRNLNGTIHAVQTIDTITVGKDVTGTIQVDALNRNGLAFRKLHVGGTMKNGSLVVGLVGNRASVGEIIIGKGLGASPADSIKVGGNIGTLRVGGVLNMSVQAANIGTLQAARVNGPVRVGTNLDNLRVTKGGLHGNVVVGGKLRNATIAGGITSDVRANNGIGNITVTRGNVASSASITSGFGALDSLRVQKGSLFGTVDIRKNIGQIVVSGDLGNGTDPMEIKGKRLGLLQVGGDVNPGVSVRIRGPIDALVVGGDIEEGALIQATALNRQDINGNVFGSLVIG